MGPLLCKRFPGADTDAGRSAEAEGVSRIVDSESEVEGVLGKVGRLRLWKVERMLEKEAKVLVWVIVLVCFFS